MTIREQRLLEQLESAQTVRDRWRDEVFKARKQIAKQEETISILRADLETMELIADMANRMLTEALDEIPAPETERD